MSEQLTRSLVFLASVIGLYYLMLLLNEIIKVFIYLLSIFKRKEDEKLVKDYYQRLKEAGTDADTAQLISALEKKDSNG
jgi:hypothetical protein